MKTEQTFRDKHYPHQSSWIEKLKELLAQYSEELILKLKK